MQKRIFVLSLLATALALPLSTYAENSTDNHTLQATAKTPIQAGQKVHVQGLGKSTVTQSIGGGSIVTATSDATHKTISMVVAPSTQTLLHQVGQQIDTQGGALGNAATIKDEAGNTTTVTYTHKQGWTVSNAPLYTAITGKAPNFPDDKQASGFLALVPTGTLSLNNFKANATVVSAPTSPIKVQVTVTQQYTDNNTKGLYAAFQQMLTPPHQQNSPNNQSFGITITPKDGKAQELTGSSSASAIQNALNAVGPGTLIEFNAHAIMNAQQFQQQTPPAPSTTS